MNDGGCQKTLLKSAVGSPHDAPARAPNVTEHPALAVSYGRNATKSNSPICRVF